MKVKMRIKPSLRINKNNDKLNNDPLTKLQPS